MVPTPRLPSREEGGVGHTGRGGGGGRHSCEMEGAGVRELRVELRTQQQGHQGLLCHQAFPNAATPAWNIPPFRLPV